MPYALKANQVDDRMLSYSLRGKKIGEKPWGKKTIITIIRRTHSGTLA